MAGHCESWHEQLRTPWCHFVNATVFLYIVFTLCKLASYTTGLSHLSNDASYL
jgi:hypothetical protein